MKEIVANLWKDIGKQNWAGLPSYFLEAAIINWHNTNESFCVNEFVRANSEYPGNWGVDVERLIESGNIVVSVVKVKSGELSFHAVSFFSFEGDKIKMLDEYWGDDGMPPQWRIDKDIGKPIVSSE